MAPLSGLRALIRFPEKSKNIIVRFALILTVVSNALFFVGCYPLPPELFVYPQFRSEQLSSEDIRIVTQNLDTIAAEYHLKRIGNLPPGCLRLYSESPSGYPAVLGFYLSESPSLLSMRAVGTYGEAIDRRLTKALQARFGKGRVRWVNRMIFNPV